MAKTGKPSVSLDSFDIKLLSALQENNQRTSEELAALVSLSPAACLRRVKRLREERVISADVPGKLLEVAQGRDGILRPGLDLTMGLLRQRSRDHQRLALGVVASR